MKKTLYLLTFLIAVVGKSQEMTVFYKEKRKADYYKLRSHVFKKRLDQQDLDLIKDKAKEHSDELEKYEYASVLRIDDTKSIYYPLEKQFNDTIIVLFHMEKMGNRHLLVGKLQRRNIKLFISIKIRNKKQVLSTRMEKNI